MTISDRDRRVIELVAEFGVLRSSHLQALAFPGLSGTPLDRCTKRLLRLRLLARLGQRDIGYTGGGSSGFAYQLGPDGHRMLGKPGRYYPKLSVAKHTLAIADCMVNLHTAGILKPGSFVPEAHHVVGDMRLDPDAFFVVQLPHEVGYVLEVDVADGRMATAHKRKLLDKMRRYWEAACLGLPMPYVLFAAPDPYRLAYIQRLIRSLPPEQQPLFKACLIQNIANF